MNEQEAIIRELQIELMRVTEERDALQKQLDAIHPVEQAVTTVVNILNDGKVDPKIVYPPGRYCGD